MFQYKNKNIQNIQKLHEKTHSFIFISSLLFNVQMTYFHIGRNATLLRKLLDTDIFMEPNIPPGYEATTVAKVKSLFHNPITHCRENCWEYTSVNVVLNCWPHFREYIVWSFLNLNKVKHETFCMGFHSISTNL